MTISKNPQIRGLFDDWLKEQGIHEEMTHASIKRVLGWQLEQAMKEHKLTKSAMAKRIDTSRPQLESGDTLP